jgi:hypothetical protein
MLCYRIYKCLFGILLCLMCKGPQIHPLILERAEQRVDVRVDEARQQGFALQVDNLGLGTNYRLEVAESAYLEDAIETNGDCLRVRLLLVHGVDIAVCEESCGFVKGVVELEVFN